MKRTELALQPETRHDYAPFPRRARISPANERVTVLVASPFDPDLISLLGILGHTAWKISWWPSYADAAGALRADVIPVVICDRQLPDGNWRDILCSSRLSSHAPRVLVCSNTADDALWTEVLESGGFDVLTKPFDGDEVLAAVSSAHRSWHFERARRGLFNHIRHAV